MGQCAAKTKDGDPCQISTQEGRKYCHVHSRKHPWRWILGIGTFALAFLGFTANITGVLGYFEIDPLGLRPTATITPTLTPTQETRILSASELMSNGSFVKIESISPSPDTVFVSGAEVAVVAEIQYLLPGNCIQPELNLEYLQEYRTENFPTWQVLQLFPAETGSHHVKLSGGFIVPEQSALKGNSFQIGVFFMVFDKEQGRKIKIASEVITYEIKTDR
jgi:hypothetical protein